MRIFSLICSNGLGHYKRSIEVLSALQKINPYNIFTVACESWQIDRMSNWEISRNFWTQQVKHIKGVVAPGVRWEKAPSNYKQGELTEWHKRLQSNTELNEADLVISDNLSQVLHYRTDAVLMGSFLWSDILGKAYPDNKEVQQFVEEEKKLLEVHKPHMICLGDMVMGAVETQTNAIKMPWFCKKINKTSKIKLHTKKKIALLSGATEGVSDLLFELAKHLNEQENFEVFLHEHLVNKNSSSTDFKLFDFSDEQFSQMSAIVCRPGIGTLTDCVRFSIPVIAVYEAGNVEMIHNASKIKLLGLGLDIPPGSSTSKMVKAISDFCTSEAIIAAKKNLKLTADNGIEEAADWLVKHYQKKINTNKING